MVNLSGSFMIRHSESYPSGKLADDRWYLLEQEPFHLIQSLFEPTARGHLILR
jgi:hypothetical protein